MKRPTALAAVFGLFLAGIIAGVLGTHLFYSHRLQSHEGPLWFMRHPPLGFLADELQLSPEQQAQADDILRDSRRRGDEIRRDMRPKLHQLMDETHESLLGVLTPEQQKKFQNLKFHRRRDGDRRRGPRHGPPGDMRRPHRPGGPHGGPPPRRDHSKGEES